MRPRVSMRVLVRPSVDLFVRPMIMFSSNSVKNAFLRILDYIDSAGRRGSRDKKEGATRRREK